MTIDTATGPRRVADPPATARPPARHTDEPAGWLRICPMRSLPPWRGVAALVGDVQVAVFRLDAGSLHAVGNIDPFTGAAVISRGIVGDRDGVPTVASPVYKQAFSLVDGRCLDDAAVCLPVYRARASGGDLWIGLR